MKYSIIVLLILLTGCATTVPVVAKFPEPPSKGQGTCPQLQTLVTDAKLSDVANTVTANYSTYYECTVKVDTWNEWYEVQRRIFEGIK
jgi:hypothetical protein